VKVSFIKNITFFILFLSAPSFAADFDFKNYEWILSHYTKPKVSIDGIIVTACNYGSLAAEAGKPGSAYQTLLKDLGAFDPETLSNREDKMAFWINVYNLAAIKTIVDHYPVDSIRSRKINWLGLPWDRKVIQVGGKDFSLNQIENHILLDTFKDLRIHFAINCASLSCVDLAQTPYRGVTLFKELEEQGRRFLADRQKGLRIDREKKLVYRSQIFKFDKRHFDELGGGALQFILPFLGFEDRDFIGKEQFTLNYLDYNWKLNDLKNAD
jgi:hypothetical protein